MFKNQAAGFYMGEKLNKSWNKTGDWININIKINLFPSWNRQQLLSDKEVTGWGSFVRYEKTIPFKIWRHQSVFDSLWRENTTLYWAIWELQSNCSARSKFVNRWYLPDISCSAMYIKGKVQHWSCRPNCFFLELTCANVTTIHIVCTCRCTRFWELYVFQNVYASFVKFLFSLNWKQSSEKFLRIIETCTNFPPNF